MNQQAFEAGKAAYQRGDWLGAVSNLGLAKQESEVDGAIDHMLGNAYMQLGQFDSAASAYGRALRDTAYGKVGAISCNMGRALLAAGKIEDAVGALSAAVQDTSYATPYKANMALGAAYERLGDVRNAGIAYRNAAIDETNPNPAVALTNLGGSFMSLGRPVDAVEAYRTALDFSTPMESQNAIWRDLGLAYVAANRMPEAVDAFQHATADGTLTLSPEAQAAFDAASKAISARSGRVSDTDAMLAAAGYGSGSFDPLDPTGESGALMPSPEDTGFFSITEEDIVAEDRRNRKVRRKHRHTGLKAFLFLLLLLLIAAGVAGYAYYRGYGWPTQQAVVESLFSARTNGEDISEELAAGISDSARQQIEDIIPAGATVEVTGVDQNMTDSTVFATATLAGGGKQDYTITMVRDGLTWKVTSVEMTFLSQGEADPSLGASASTEDEVSEGEVSLGEEVQSEAPAN